MKMLQKTFHDLDDISSLKVGREYEEDALLACILCTGKLLGIVGIGLTTPHVYI